MEFEPKDPTHAEAPEESARPAPDVPRSAPSPRRVHWRRILAGVGPREVLARLMEGDPLDVRRRVDEGLRRRAYLFDADRVFLRALARIARLACRYRGRPALAAWVAERVDESLLDLLREDREAELRGDPAAGMEVAAFEDLAAPLGLEPRRMRSVCVAFNHLPEPQRRAFLELVIEGRSLDELAGRGIPATEIARRARGALEAVLSAEGRP